MTLNRLTLDCFILNAYIIIILNNVMLTLQEITEISRIIDAHAFMKFNKSCFDFCPQTPIYTTDAPEHTPEENKNRIDKIIKDFVIKQKKAGY